MRLRKITYKSRPTDAELIERRQLFNRMVAQGAMVIWIAGGLRFIWRTVK